MTHEDIVYDRRVRLIEYAAKIGNLAEACRVFGVSRYTELRVDQEGRADGPLSVAAERTQVPASAQRDDIGGGRGDLG